MRMKEGVGEEVVSGRDPEEIGGVGRGVLQELVRAMRRRSDK
jgi:hypothetical protein